MFLVNSRLGLSSATSRKLGPELPPTLIPHRPHFSRSYVCILPSSLTRVLSSALDYSSRLPVSVYGTVFGKLTLETISRRLDSLRSSSSRRSTPLNGSPQVADLPTTLNSSTAWTGTTIARLRLASRVISSNLPKVREYKPVSHRLRFSASP